MEVLSGRWIIRPRDPEASHRFYGKLLGLAVYREFGPPEAPGRVYFCGNLLLEISGRAEAEGTGDPCRPTALWLQVRDVAAAHRQLRAAGAVIDREPRTEPWGLVEMWLSDPDGNPVVIVEIPGDHPLRTDSRPAG